ncbi:MAG: hypothetical protein AAGD32_14285 [Planctomycetota bacterium]
MRAALITLALIAVPQPVTALTPARPQVGAPGVSVQASLDRQLSLNLTAAPLEEAIAAIEDAAGIPIRVPVSTYDRLPYGRLTPITLRSENVPLSQVLDALSGRLALVVDRHADGFLQLLPEPALIRLGRRAAPGELALIQHLATSPFEGDLRQLTLVDLLTQLDLALLDQDTRRLPGREATGFHVEIRLADDLLREQPVSISREMSMLDALEAAAEQSDATWYPWGKTIVVVGDRDHVNWLLDTPIDVRYDGSDLQQVLLDLSRRSAVPFDLAPGLIDRLPPEKRRVRLTAPNVSTRAALEAISAYTGLRYEVTAEGVRITAVSNEPRIVGLIDNGDGTFRAVYEDDITDAERAKLAPQ